MLNNRHEACYLPKPSKISVASTTGGNITLTTRSRSAHQQGNREGHVPFEEAEGRNGVLRLRTLPPHPGCKNISARDDRTKIFTQIKK